MTHYDTATVLIYLSFVATVVWLAMANGAPPTRIGAVGILAGLATVLEEVHEIRVASWLRITFRPGRWSAEDDP